MEDRFQFDIKKKNITKSFSHFYTYLTSRIDKLNPPFLEVFKQVYSRSSSATGGRIGSSGSSNSSSSSESKDGIVIAIPLICKVIERRQFFESLVMHFTIYIHFSCQILFISQKWENKA